MFDHPIYKKIEQALYFACGFSALYFAWHIWQAYKRGFFS